jgi:hypothetical protein
MQFYINQTTSSLVHNLSTFGDYMNHGQIRTHETHHDLDLGEATTFPLIILSMPFHEAHIQMAFCFRTPKWEFQNSHSWDSYDFLGAHNFTCRPSIVMKFKAKL